MARFRRPTRAAVAKSLRDLSFIWRPPDDPEMKTAAEVGTEAAAKESRNTANLSTTRGAPGKGAA